MRRHRPDTGGRERRGPSSREIRPGHQGIGRRSPAAAEQVSDDLRLGSGDLLQQRRRVAALGLGAATAYAVVALYQFGLVKHLPEPPLPGVDADRVDASGEAYALLHTPDAALGLASVGATLALTGAGSRRRHRERPWLVFAATGKVAADAAMALWLTAEQLTKHRRICSWCTLAAACHLAAVPPAAAEARAALSAARRHRP
ncbi:vitamin K epoxide reductase family protein [Streptomyces sp. YIM 98790]|uniref:vitamin K epoxide reductase family protein n=1 Tax=Streptomyces sp. YIM 98790 TaxID=2689077 RepID=UPI00140A1073|nr:vitamin K epoxide reductase family protein [Streptomyces sp. YIM 98790]